MKAINLFKFLLLSGIALLFVACEAEDSVDVNQNKIYTDYEVFYDSNSDKTWVVARFKFGNATGTVLELKDVAFVTFNGDTLPYNGWYAGHFKEYAGRISTGSFSYTNNDGDVFVNSIPSVDTIAFPSDLDTLDKSAAYTITWGGSTLVADENVGIFIGSWVWAQDALIFQDGDGSNNIVIGTNQMANLAVGQSTCYMDRSKDVAVTQGTEKGGRIRNKYRATNKVIQVVE